MRRKESVRPGRRLEERADKWAYYAKRQPVQWLEHVNHWMAWANASDIGADHAMLILR